jgi:hypothetical protein
MNMNVFDPNFAELVHDAGHVPTLNEQAAMKVRRAGHHAPWYNAWVTLLLRSRLHGLISGSVMLLSVHGRKSGSVSTMPVGYITGEDGRLYVISLRHRRWWRNLREGGPVSLRLRGQERRGFGVVVTNLRAVTNELARVMGGAPAYAAKLHVRRNADGTLSTADLEALARQYVLVSIRLE